MHSKFVSMATNQMLQMIFTHLNKLTVQSQHILYVLEGTQAHTCTVHYSKNVFFPPSVLHVQQYSMIMDIIWIDIIMFLHQFRLNMYMYMYT